MKELPSHLKYSFLEQEKEKPVIISIELTENEEHKLLKILRKYKEAIAWSIEDLKGISHSICMHKILLEDNAKTLIEHQRRLNPVTKDVVRKEVLKWLNAGFIYAISYSPWVSQVHVVPRNGGFTAIRNERYELIPTRTVIGWRAGAAGAPQAPHAGAAGALRGAPCRRPVKNWVYLNSGDWLKGDNLKFSFNFTSKLSQFLS